MVYFLARPMKISHLGPTLNFEAFYSKNDNDFVDVSESYATERPGQPWYLVNSLKIVTDFAVEVPKNLDLNQM